MEIEGLRSSGDKVFFEYHCFESLDSQDADLWLHSHQEVEIVELAPNDSHYPDDPSVVSEPSFRERMEAGQPIVYEVRFEDGYVGAATEDELLNSADEYTSEDPPPPPAIIIFKGNHSFLSNFYVGEPIEIDRISFQTAEHAYQASKTLLRDDKMRVQKVATPGRAKRMGRKVPLRADWDREKDDCMRTILHAKFRDPALKNKLLGTGDRELIEGNKWGDTYWGVCDGEGQNKLGKMLMRIRDESKI